MVDKLKNMVLFMVATHGDEGFSLPILRNLDQKIPRHSPWLVANERALERGVRFIDTDLNRAAPGDPNAEAYEMRRAHEILKMTQHCAAVIDIHGTTANSGIFVIVTNPTPHNIGLAASLPIQNVVIWAARDSQKSGPLTQFMPCAVEIECGPKDSESMWGQLRLIINYILKKGLRPIPNKGQRWFQVYGSLPKNASSAEQLIDFKQVTVGEETFYPLLVGQYDDVRCYKMRAVNFRNLFAY